MCLFTQCDVGGEHRVALLMLRGECGVHQRARLIYCMHTEKEGVKRGKRCKEEIINQSEGQHWAARQPHPCEEGSQPAVRLRHSQASSASRPKSWLAGQQTAHQYLFFSPLSWAHRPAHLGQKNRAKKWVDDDDFNKHTKHHIYFCPARNTLTLWPLMEHTQTNKQAWKHSLDRLS